MSARTRKGMSSASLLSLLTLAVEDDMRDLWAELRTTSPFYDWIEYHLGWRDLPEGGPVKPGKHLRSLLLLLLAQMFGCSIGRALPLASAVELLHNATLVYDDIQDAGALRRGRPALWRLSGAAQAINVGVALQASVHAAAARGARAGLSAQAVLDAMEELTLAMQILAEGQYLDLRFGGGGEPGIDQYMDICARKAGSLLGSSAFLGAAVAGRGDLAEVARRLGHHLGMYLQISDDIDGIWGETAHIGKVADDLVQKRKTLPLLYAFQRLVMEEGGSGPTAGLRGRFFGEDPLLPGDAAACLEVMQRYDARGYTVTLANLHAESAGKALGELQSAATVPGALAPLFEEFSRASAAGRLGALLPVGVKPAVAKAAQVM